MHFEFQTVEATKNICSMKREGAVDYSIVTRWFKKFCTGGKNLDDQAKSDRPKIVDSEAILQTIEANPVSSTRRVSGELSLSQSSVVFHIHDLSKYIKSCRIMFHITKILQNFHLLKSKKIFWWSHPQFIYHIK